MVTPYNANSNQVLHSMLVDKPQGTVLSLRDMFVSRKNISTQYISEVQQLALSR